MKPIVMTVGALRRLAKCAYPDADRAHIQTLVFRAADVCVTDGHTLVSIPLPRAARRKFDVSAPALLSALDGARAFDTATLEHADGLLRIAVEARCFVAVLETTNAASAPDFEVIFALRPPETSLLSDFHLDGKMLSRVGKLAHDCGWRPSAIDAKQPCHTKPVSIAWIGGATDPVMFNFATKHGTARVVVMPVRR